MVATPSRKLVSLSSQPTVDEEKKYRLAGSKPARLCLKAYVHGKSNRNVFITGSSSQEQVNSLFAWPDDIQKTYLLPFKAGEEYLKYLNSDLCLVSLKQKKYQKFERSEELMLYKSI